jgi:hypothetical protein
MSLINEALKRAKEKQTQSPPPPLEFRKAEEPPRRRSHAPVIAALVLGLIVTGGTALLVVSLFKRQAEPLEVGARTAPPLVQPQPAPAQSETRTAVARVVSTIQQAAKLADENPEDYSPRPTFPGENDTNTLPVAATQSPPKPSGPKLQGIFYNPARPSAVINGRTVYVGHTVGSSRVVQITRDTVTLVSVAATNVLSLSE